MKLATTFLFVFLFHFINSQPKYTHPHSSVCQKSKDKKSEMVGIKDSASTHDSFQGMVFNHSSNYKNNLTGSVEKYTFLDFQIHTNDQFYNYKFQFRQK